MGGWESHIKINIHNRHLRMFVQRKILIKYDAIRSFLKLNAELCMKEHACLFLLERESIAFTRFSKKTTQGQEACIQLLLNISLSILSFNDKALNTFCVNGEENKNACPQFCFGTWILFTSKHSLPRQPHQNKRKPTAV